MAISFRLADTRPERLRNECLQEAMQARDLDRKPQQYATAYGMSNSQFQKVFHEKKPTNKVLLLL